MFGNFSRSPQEDYIATLRVSPGGSGEVWTGRSPELNNATDDHRYAVATTPWLKQPLRG